MQFPPLYTEKQLADTKLVQNGFYSREPLSLQGEYQKKSHPFVAPLDERFAFNTRDTFQRDTNVFLKENLLYQPNVKLMREIQAREDNNAQQSTMFDN